MKRKTVYEANVALQSQYNFYDDSKDKVLAMSIKQALNPAK